MDIDMLAQVISLSLFHLYYAVQIHYYFCILSSHSSLNHFFHSHVFAFPYWAL